jgi:hypothetical protein
LKKLDLLEKINEDLKCIRQTNRKFAERYNQKSCENSEKIQENANIKVAEEKDEERTWRESEKDSDKIDENQNVTNELKIDSKLSMIEKDSATKKKKKKVKEGKEAAALKFSSKFAILLNLEETRILIRQKKVKCDDGG